MRKINHSGFTLIELVVTMALLAIMMSLAVPSLVTFRRNAELTSTVNLFVASLQSARSEAMKRNVNAMVIATVERDWTQGWTVFVDRNNNGTFEPNSDAVVLSQPALPAYFSITGNQTFNENPAYFIFDASGFPRVRGSGFPGNATLKINRNDAVNDYSQTRFIKISVAGRVSVCTPKNATDAACPFSD